MDFLTVPILSVFVMPILSEYSSRLNLLFFYMSWTTLVVSLRASRIEMLSTLITRIVCWIIPSCIFFIFDALAPGVAVKLKEGGESGLPSGSKKHRAISRYIWKIPGVCLLNFVGTYLLQWVIELMFDKFTFQRVVQVKIAVPLPWHIATDVILGLMLREVLSYSVHRWVLHSSQPALAWIARKHDNWFHGLRGALPLTSHYDHPIPYVLHNFFPMYYPVYYFQFHAITYVIYTMIICIEETFTYSGYSIIPSSILQGSASRVNMHLNSGGKKYFGRFGLVDFFMGTGSLMGNLAQLGGGGGGGGGGDGSDRGRR